MLFQKRHKNAVKIFWTVASIIIILSMIALFGPVAPQATTVQRQDTSQEQTVEINPEDIQVETISTPATE